MNFISYFYNILNEKLFNQLLHYIIQNSNTFDSPVYLCYHICTLIIITVIILSDNSNRTSIGSAIKSADKTAGGITKGAQDIAKSLTGGVGIDAPDVLSDAVTLAEDTFGAAKKVGNVLKGKGATPPEEAQKSGYTPSNSPAGTGSPEKGGRQ